MPAVGVVTGDGNKEYPGNVTLYVFVAATEGLIFGYNIGISGRVTTMESFQKKFLPSVYEKDHESSIYCRFNSISLTLFTSSLYLAAFSSCVVAFYFTRKFGRKLSMLLGGILFCAGALLNGFATAVWMLFVGRLLLGFGIGFIYQVLSFNLRP